MKLKKVLATILAAAMVLSTMGTVAFADATIIEVANNEELATAIATAVDGDIIKLAAGEYSAFDVSGKNITVEGKLDADGEHLTVIKDSNLAITGHNFNGTIKNLKIVDAFKTFYAEPAGNIVFDNLYVTGGTYGIHAVAYENDKTWTIQNSYMDISWANSFGKYTGEGATEETKGATIIIKNNEFESTSPYYSGYGVPFVNTSSPDTVVEDNIFGENARIKFLNQEAATGTEIGLNYYADGVENVIVSDNEYVVAPIAAWYETEDMDEDKVVVNEIFVAKVGDTYYETLKEAIYDAVDGDTIYLMNEINEGSIKLPATIRNLTIDGQESAVVKDTTINAADGNYVDVQGLTIKNTTFDNSRFVLGGQRANNVIYKDLVFDNNKFVNIVNNASMAAIHMNLASEDNEYIENFTFTDNVIDGVTGSNNSGVLLNGITGDIVFEGNTVSNVAWNAVQIATAKADAKLVVENNSFASSGSSVLNIAAAPSAILENNTVVNDSGRIGLWYPAEAKIGDVLYIDIQTAINNAKDGDTITILAGEYEGFDIPATKNNLTFVGETGSTGLSRSVENLVTIKTLDTGIESHNGGIFVGAENTTFKNLNFTAGTTPGASSDWMSSSLGNTNGDTGMSSSLKNLTVENCNFTGSGAYQAIWTNQGNVTVKNTTIKNYANGIDNYGIGADQKVVIENSKITDVHNAFHTGEAADGAQIVVTGTDIDSEVINIGGAVAVTVEESTIKNAAVTTYASSTFAVSESALYDTTYAVDANATGSITLNAVYANNVNALAANAKADNIAFNTYYPEAKDLGTGNTVAVPAATDAIYVKFENVTDADAEGEMTYNINLVATDTEIINRLNSADLTFAFDATEGDVAYEIIASNSEVAVNPVDNSKVRYEFHYNGKDGVTTDSANKITIGQVRFEGYGKFDFTVDAAVDTNTAHATTVADNIVDTFIPNGDAATVANGELVIDDTTITDVVIAVPDRNLTISIDFPNAVEDQVIAYQDMKVVISGGDLAKDITIDLGNDAVETALDIFGKEDAKFAAAMDNNGSYVINVTDALTLNNAYTVTVSGAGYRTARYTVTMTTDKTLRFWNNVMDENQVVELGKDSSIAKVTFLAGDIVKDNNINIYDLSAVVSYFGSVSTTENGYAKYDLNRDGVIDSKDVAYVLVSWNN